jgi:uncharacterized protein (DUF305 family)
MKNSTVVIMVAVALVIGHITGYAFNNNDHKETPKENSSVNMSETMGSMTSGLQDKTGDEFDKAFITEMIVHHEGAVSMAHMAFLNAKHQEIKTMADQIINAQTLEIEQMKEWLKSWYGIEAVPETNHPMH